MPSLLRSCLICLCVCKTNDPLQYANIMMNYTWLEDGDNSHFMIGYRGSQGDGGDASSWPMIYSILWLRLLGYSSPLFCRDAQPQYEEQIRQLASQSTRDTHSHARLVSIRLMQLEQTLASAAVAAFVCFRLFSPCLLLICDQVSTQQTQRVWPATQLQEIVCSSSASSPALHRALHRLR